MALYIIGAIVVLLLLVIISNISVVQQSRAYVIERLGAFHSVWSVGLHFKIPFIDRVARRVSLKEQVLDYPPQPVITKDNVTMQIDTVVYFQITDPKLYAYGVYEGHLNPRGASKVTAFLGVWLAENYDLEDRRGDHAYAYWDENLKKYEARRAQVWED